MRLVSVIGASKATPEEYEVAYCLGKELAKMSFGVVCGGRDGVMEAVCKGAWEEGGLTIGIMPSYDGREANPYVKVRINTGMNHNRNPIVVASGELVVAVGSSYGTLSEIAYALILQKPVLGYRTYRIYGVKHYKNLETMLTDIKSLLGSNRA